MTLTDISQQLGLAPSTTHRLLATLQMEGLVEHEGRSRRYRLGGEVIRLAMRPLRDEQRLISVAKPVLEDLHAVTGETVHLAVIRGTEVVTIEQIESLQTLLVRQPRGLSVPTHATATGKALVAHLPHVAAAIVAAGLDRITEYTITDAASFELELQLVRERGYALNERQRNRDTAGVAATVFLDETMPIAAIGISGPASRVHGEAIPRLGEQARQAASNLTVRLRSVDWETHP